ncbi:MAG: deoxyribodipyrimidine photo-lyase [Pseudomonadota bacterium]
MGTSANTAPVIVWFRQDLRLTDNPALHAAVETGAPVLPVYILDDDNAGDYSMGAASRWWLHHSLTSLNESLGGTLVIKSGNAAALLPALARDIGAQHVYWNRCYEPWRIQRDSAIKVTLRGDDRSVRSFNGSLLFEPVNVLKSDRTPYRVFTPFYRNAREANEASLRAPLEAPAKLNLLHGQQDLSIDDLGLLPDIPWYEEMATLWQPGEDGARARLAEFLDGGLDNYKEGRDRPDLRNVSRLSPHLHYGEISPNQAWFAAADYDELHPKHVEHFQRELGWREFSYNLLFHFPTLPFENFQRKFNRFPWRGDQDQLEQWQRGMTGVPIVDAGMRELWRTGYMHNRVRMIVGSFLVKNLMIDWRHGEKWFFDTLLDADLASNSASWQWIAGCGADAAPYFRIFNPVTQGKKFDPNGDYVREYVSEIAAIPNQYLHNPWEAPADVLQQAGVDLGGDYPKPLVDLKASRQRALDAFSSLRSASD